MSRWDGSIARRLGQIFAVGVLGALGAGAVALVPLVPTTLFGRVPTPSGTVTAEPAQVAVVDGGTLRLRDAVIRLEGVDAPARGRSCHAPDGSSFDCGAAATRALASLVRDHAVSCRLSGRDDAGFTQAKCDAAGTELNHAVVASGFARARVSEPALAADEDAARTQRLGLWRDAANGNF